MSNASVSILPRQMHVVLKLAWTLCLVCVSDKEGRSSTSSSSPRACVRVCVSAGAGCHEACKGALRQIQFLVCYHC